MQRAKVLFGIMLLYMLIAAILFATAGSSELPMFWLYLLVMIVLTGIAITAVYPRIPEMLQEQRRSGEGNQDRFTGPTLQALLLSHWIIAGLDVGRYHWTSSIPAVLQIIGLLISGCGFGLLAWSIIVNRFYSPRVDIQTERGQEVITTGPYHFIRHPGYTGWIMFMIFSGLALGSWLSVLPTLVLTTCIIRRTIIEDRMLWHDLNGYPEYAHRVRYRLIPGLW